MKMFLPLSAALLTMAVVCLPVRAEQNVASSADAMSASAAVDLPNPLETEPTAFDHVVYLARLPAPAELLKGAKSQGISITRMDQTSDRVVVVYQHSGGRTVTFAYTLLSAAANYPAPAVKTTAGEEPKVVYAEPSRVTEVIYTEPRTVYYRPRYVRYYDPAWDFWGPLALGIGIGWNGGHGHGHGWHGGVHHGGHGGWRR